MLVEGVAAAAALLTEAVATVAEAVVSAVAVAALRGLRSSGFRFLLACCVEQAKFQLHSNDEGEASLGRPFIGDREEEALTEQP